MIDCWLLTIVESPSLRSHLLVDKIESIHQQKINPSLWTLNTQPFLIYNKNPQTQNTKLSEKNKRIGLHYIGLLLINIKPGLINT